MNVNEVLNSKEKKRLIDSRSIAKNHKGWIEFNIISAVENWKQHPNRNFGLFVEIEDPLGNKLNPSAYLMKMNCSGKYIELKFNF